VTESLCLGIPVFTLSRIVTWRCWVISDIMDILYYVTTDVTSSRLDLKQSINQSINQFISRHKTEARASVRLCRIKEKCLKTDVKCVNGWSSSTVYWKRIPKSWSSDRETTSSSVQVVRRNWQKLLYGWSQQARLTVWADQISEVAWLLERNNQPVLHSCCCWLQIVVPHNYNSIYSHIQCSILLFGTSKTSSC